MRITKSVNTNDKNSCWLFVKLFNTLKLMLKFSITIPAYKRTYLKDAIDSCLAQTYENFELIIVNDASPEELDSIINSYSDIRIRYYKNKTNCGAINVVDNWNKCLEYAKGDYIICMGDDDCLLPYCLEEYLKLIEKYPELGVYHAWTEIIDESGNFVNMTAARPEFESVYSLIWHRWVEGRSQYIGDFLFDTKLLRKNGGFYKLPLAWGSDDISVIIAAKPLGIANTQTPCFCYRVNSHTISNTSNSNYKMIAILDEIQWYKVFLKEIPTSELDIKYRECIIRIMPHYFDKKKGITIAKDLTGTSYFKLLYWIKNRRKYNLTTRCFIHALIQSFK